ncbi:MAG: hypothetical protein ACREQE_11355 [Candidatus Binataceae bacterium]
MTPKQEAEFDSIGRQLEFGGPAVLVPFMETPLVHSLEEALALGNAGLGGGLF